MAVPNTTTFSLNDVRVELGLGATASLSSCIAAAVGASYDPAYYTAPATGLLEFRNYGVVCASTTSLNFYPSSGQATSGSGTCPSGGSEIPHYFIGAGANVANGDTVTTDVGGCNVFVGGNLWYRVRSNTSGFLSVRVSDTGVASSIISCT